MEESNINALSLLLALIATAIILGLGLFFIKPTNMSEQNTTTKVVECNHEYVTTSRYSFLLNCYKTYSVCTKCGKEI